MILPSIFISALAGCCTIRVMSLVGWAMFSASSSDNVVRLELLRERECERIIKISLVRWRVLFEAAVPPFLNIL